MNPMRIYLTLAILFSLQALFAGDAIFNVEAQSVIGYYNESDNPIYYSDNQRIEMQKPSIGFDYLQNFSSETRTYADLAIQYRLAWNEMGKTKFENQIYNAYIKFKTSPADIKIGHIRPAFGFTSYTDNHALLVHNFTMHGMGYDRDWGASISREFERFNINTAYTLGSGMSIHTMGNYLLTGRLGYGYLNEDNYTTGISVFHGETLATQGVYLKNHSLTTTNYLGWDSRLFYRNFEFNTDFLIGKKENIDLMALMYRQTINLLDENKLKLDIQPVWVKANGNDNLKLGIGFSYRIHPDITIRTLLERDHDAKDNWAILQIYFYKNAYTGALL